MTHSSVLFVARANFAGLFFIVFAVEINRSVESAFLCVCVCHNGHQLFGIGYHLRIFRSQVATEKKSLFYALSSHKRPPPMDTYGRFDCV